MQLTTPVVALRNRQRPIVPVAVPDIHENFPFTVSLADTEERLHKAVDIRAEAYGRHMPELAARFREVEALDREEGVTVLVAESKLDGSSLGSIRIQTNQHRPLLIEQATTLPFPKGWLLAESTRLAVCQQGIGRMVKLALVRATYQYCIQAGIDCLVIGARQPLDRQYRGLLFQDLHPGCEPIPLPYANNIPHHVLYWHIASVADNFKAANHPMYQFMTEPDHPDIDLMGIERNLVITH